MRWGVIAIGLALAGCGARMVPPAAGPSAPVSNYNPPAARPQGSTPIAPQPVAVIASATNALGAGVVAGPAIGLVAVQRRAGGAFARRVQDILFVVDAPARPVGADPG